MAGDPTTPTVNQQLSAVIDNWRDPRHRIQFKIRYTFSPKLQSRKQEQNDEGSSQHLLAQIHEMNQWSRTALVLTVAGIWYWAATQYTLELFALAWHARHGKAASLKNVEGKTYTVVVPTFWFAELDEGGWELFVGKKPGRIRATLGDREWAMMRFSVGPTYSTGEDLRWSQLHPYIIKKAGYTLAETGTIKVAGQELYCFEHKFENGRAADLARAYDLVDLQCAPLTDRRSFAAWYTGSRSLTPEFYMTLHTVTRTEK